MNEARLAWRHSLPRRGLSGPNGFNGTRRHVSPRAQRAGGRGSGADDLVVAAAPELEQAEAIAERVGHVGHASPLLLLDVALERGARGPGALDDGVEVCDGEVQMDGG